MRFSKILKAVPIAVVLLSSHLAISQQQVRPPKLNLWMDLSTSSFAGMPDMEGMAGGGGLLGGLMGAAAGATGTGGPLKTYGHARSLSLMPSRVVDIALLNAAKPGQEASQSIPPGMKMGDALPLIPPVRLETRKDKDDPELPPNFEKPKGRILIYWGCSEAVRPGQPRIIDLAGDPSKFGTAFSGRFAPDRSVRVTDKHAVYPNERNTVNLSKSSSLVGEHQLSGDGIPASMRFSLNQSQDLMPAIDLQTNGAATGSIGLNWPVINQAKAYFLSAFGSSGDDMIIWSSSEVADAGMGLMDYLPNATIDKWLRERVLLEPATTSCAVPQGIFAGKQGSRSGGGAMAQMIAFGGESYIVHPPKPADAKQPWNQEWAVRVRVKSQTMAALGGDDGGNTRRRASSNTTSNPSNPSGPTETPTENPTPLGGAVNILKGIFGR